MDRPKQTNRNTFPRNDNVFQHNSWPFQCFRALLKMQGLLGMKGFSNPPYEERKFFKSKNKKVKERRKAPASPAVPAKTFERDGRWAITRRIRCCRDTRTLNNSCLEVEKRLRARNHKTIRGAAVGWAGPEGRDLTKRGQGKCLRAQRRCTP